MSIHDYVGRLRAAGINVETLDGYDQPHMSSGFDEYLWRSGEPVCSMWHHTASAGYTPNRDKANMWAGLMAPSGRLYQSGGGVPTIVIANLYPAPISSGYGQKLVIDRAVADHPNPYLATGPDDTHPRYAANRDAWNTEVVLDGIGTAMDDAVWEMIIRAAAVLHDLMGWSEHRAIGHAQFTARKIDLRDGRYPTAQETMTAFRNDLQEAGMAEAFATWVAGWVKGLAEDPAKTRQEFTRLNTEQQPDGGYILEPANDPATVDYFVSLLDQPYHQDWPGFYARTELSVWGR